MADGGEGTLDVLGGPNRIVAGHRSARRSRARPGGGWTAGTAVIEMARASGLELVGGAEGNDPMEATTIGTASWSPRPSRPGPAASSSAWAARPRPTAATARSRRSNPCSASAASSSMVACDVDTAFVDAAVVLRPPEGGHVRPRSSCCRRRLERLAQVYLERLRRRRHRWCRGRGAAGGLAGALAAVGAELRRGFDLVADEVDLPGRLVDADLVVTGEGFVDRQSLEGKVVGGVEALARRLGVGALVVCGDIEDGLELPCPVVSLVERFGEERALADTTACVAEVVEAHLRSTSP